MTRAAAIVSAFVYLAASFPAAAQTCSIEAVSRVLPTYAGENEPATQAILLPVSVGSDAAGNVYIADITNRRIRKVTSAGLIQTVAGNGRRGSDGDGGPALQATVTPGSMAVLPDGTVYFADTHRIRRVSRDGVIATVAGTGIPGFNGESGPAVSMHLNGPDALTADSAGNVYFADRNNNRIRKLSGDGRLTTIAGSTRVGSSSDIGDGGPAVHATLNSPKGAFLLQDGRWLIAEGDLASTRLRRIELDGTIRTIGIYSALWPLHQHPNGDVYGGDGREIYRLTPDGQRVADPAYTVSNVSSLLGFLRDGGAVYQRSDISSGGFLSLARPVWVFDGAQQRLLAGASPALEPTREGPAAASFVMPSPVAPRPDGGAFFTSTVPDRGPAVFLLDANQVITRVLGGGTDEGNPDGKPALSLKVSISEIGTLADGTLVAEVLTMGRLWLVRVAGTEVRVVRDFAGTILFPDFRRNRQTNSRGIESDSAGNLFVLSGGRSSPRGGEELDVIVIRADARISKYPADNLRHLVRLPDGGVAAAVSNGNRYIRLGLTATGETLPLMEGVLPIERIFVGDFLYAPVGFRLFRRSMTGGPWQAAEFQTAFIGPTWAGPGDSLMFFSSLPTIWRIAIPSFCEFEIGPSVPPRSIVNAASFSDPDVASPGQLLTLFGENLGPEMGHGLFLTPSGLFGDPPTGAAVQIGRFSTGGTWYYAPAPVLFANRNQINVQAPYIWPPGEYDVFIVWRSGSLPDVRIPYPGKLRIQDTNPGLFTFSGRDGPGAVLNQDGSINSASNPAATGGIISLFATGLGQTSPESETGGVSPCDPLPRLVATVAVRIGGRDATVEYAGGAPGLTSGLTQINVRLPLGVSGPAVPVSIQAGGRSTEAAQNVTVAIR